MSKDFLSQVFGGISYSCISDSCVAAIRDFLDSPDIISAHMSKTTGYQIAYSLPPANVTNVGIEFSDAPGEHLNVAQSLSIVVSLLKGLGVEDIAVSVVVAGSRYDEIKKFVFQYGRIMSSKATIVFQAFS